MYLILQLYTCNRYIYKYTILKTTLTKWHLVGGVQTNKCFIIPWLILLSSISYALTVSHASYPSSCSVVSSVLNCNIDEGQVIDVGYTVGLGTENATNVVVSYEKPSGWVVAPYPTSFLLFNSTQTQSVNVTIVPPASTYGTFTVNVSFNNNTTRMVFNVERWEFIAQRDMEVNGNISVTNPSFSIKLISLTSGDAELQLSGGYSGTVSLDEGESWIQQISGTYVNITAMYIGSYIASMRVMTENPLTTVNYTGPSSQTLCGDGLCGSGETYSSCPADCTYSGGNLQFDFSMYSLNIETGGTTNLYFTLMNTRSDKTISNINLYGMRNYHTASGEDKPLDIQNLIKTSLAPREQMTVAVKIDAIGVPVGSYSPILIAKGYVDGMYVTSELYFDITVLSRIIPQGTLPESLEVDIPEFASQNQEFNVSITGIPLSYSVTYTHDSSINGSEVYKAEGTRIWRGKPASNGNLFFMITIKDGSNNIVKTEQSTIYVTTAQQSPSFVLALETTPSSPTPGQYVNILAKNVNTGLVVQGATILVNGEQRSGFTAEACKQYTIVANFIGYQSTSSQLTAQCYQFQGIEIEPEEPEYGDTIFITVLDRYGNPFPQATIKVDSKNVGFDGSWIASEGTHTISATNSEYSEKTRSVTVPLPALEIVKNITKSIGMGQNITATFSRNTQWAVYTIDQQGYLSSTICSGTTSKINCLPNVTGSYYVEAEGKELGIVVVSSGWDILNFNFDLGNWQTWGLIALVVIVVLVWASSGTESGGAGQKKKYGSMPIVYEFSSE